jgi:hypothetical protein
MSVNTHRRRFFHSFILCISLYYTMKYRGAGKSLARPGRKQAPATEDFEFHVSYFLIIIVGILVLFIYITRVASNETF